MKKIAVVLLMSQFLYSGFANAQVGDGMLQKRAAFALNVDDGDVSVSNRSQDGVRTDFIAKTPQGSFRCYVTSVQTPSGLVVSDAICAGNKGKPAGGKSSANCNELLRQAGRC